MLFTYSFFFFGRKNLEFCYLSDFKKYLMNSWFTPREKEGNEKQIKDIFSQPLSHSCLVIGWIGVGRSSNIRKILKCIKM